MGRSDANMCQYRWHTEGFLLTLQRFLGLYGINLNNLYSMGILSTKNIKGDITGGITAGIV
ncbi:MAG: hypothetical protein ACI4UL_10250, partial [Muribaculaceae bacterium]